MKRTKNQGLMNFLTPRPLKLATTLCLFQRPKLRRKTHC